MAVGYEIRDEAIRQAKRLPKRELRERYVTQAVTIAQLQEGLRDAQDSLDHQARERSNSGQITTRQLRNFEDQLHRLSKFIVDEVGLHNGEGGAVDAAIATIRDLQGKQAPDELTLQGFQDAVQECVDKVASIELDAAHIQLQLLTAKAELTEVKAENYDLAKAMAQRTPVDGPGAGLPNRAFDVGTLQSFDISTPEGLDDFAAAVQRQLPDELTDDEKQRIASSIQDQFPEGLPPEMFGRTSGPHPQEGFTPDDDKPTGLYPH